VKIEVGRLETRTLAGVLEVFEMGFYRLQNVFECKNVGRNRLGSSKVEDCRSKTRTVNPGSSSAIEVFESVLNMLLLCKYEGKNNKANGQNWLSGVKTRNTTMGSCRGAENGLKRLKIDVYWLGSTFEVIAGV